MSYEKCVPRTNNALKGLVRLIVILRQATDYFVNIPFTIDYGYPA